MTGAMAPGTGGGTADGAVDRAPSRDWSEALAGARAMAPFLLAYIPFGPVVGATVAAWVGLAVFAGTTVRAALEHEDPALPAPSATAVLVIAAAMALVHRGRSLPLSLGARAVVYLAIVGGTRVLG